MKRPWLGWIVCGLSAMLFVYMAVIEVPGISCEINHMDLPDVVVFGYDLDGAVALHAAFKAQHALAAGKAEQSASAAYVSMHRGSDLLFPPMLAASLAFLGLAGFNASNHEHDARRFARIMLGLVFALAFVYLGFDYAENAVADTMFGPDALNSDLNAELVPVLRGLTIGKYLSIAVASILIAALWIGRWRHWRGRPKPAA